jgi:NADPH:quinone reductase-like Zn-dependent oxidoreductase
VKELTGGVGADHIVEVGGADTLARSLKAIRVGGAISVIGVLSGKSAELPLTYLLMQNVRMQGVMVGSRDMFENMNRAIEIHRMRPIVDRVFSFEEARSAFEYLGSGKHFGKICIRC